MVALERPQHPQSYLKPEESWEHAQVPFRTKTLLEFVLARLPSDEGIDCDRSGFPLTAESFKNMLVYPQSEEPPENVLVSSPPKEPLENVRARPQTEESPEAVPASPQAEALLEPVQVAPSAAGAVGTRVC